MLHKTLCSLVNILGKVGVMIWSGCEPVPWGITGTRSVTDFKTLMQTILHSSFTMLSTKNSVFFFLLSNSFLLTLSLKKVVKLKLTHSFL